MSSLPSRVAVAFLGIALCAPPSAAGRHTLPSQYPQLSQADYFTTRSPGGDYRITANPRIIAAQLRLALARQEQALDLLQTSSDPQTLAQVMLLVDDGYVLLRTAIHGLRAVNPSGLPAQLLTLAESLIERARTQLRHGLIDLDRAQRGHQEHASTAIDRLRAAATDTETALGLLP